MDEATIFGRFPVKKAKIDESTSGEKVIVAAVTGKSIRVISIMMTLDAADDLTWRSNTIDITGPMDFPISGGLTHSERTGLFWTEIGEDLRLNIATGAQVSGVLTYIEIDHASG